MSGCHLFPCRARANGPTFVSASLLVARRSAASFSAVNYLTCSSPTTKPIIKSSSLLHTKICKEGIHIEAIRAACETLRTLRSNRSDMCALSSSRQRTRASSTPTPDSHETSRMSKRSTAPRNPSTLPAQQVTRTFSHLARWGVSSRKSKEKKHWT